MTPANNCRASGPTLNTGDLRAASSDDGSGTLNLAEPSCDQKTERGTAPPMPLSRLSAGDQLDRYRILDVLGRGGMGIVFKALDTVLERVVAIKVLGPLLADNPEAPKRFIREGQTAAAVNHEHIVTVYGVEGQQTAPYLVLEYVAGSSLEDLLAKGGPLPVEEVVRLGIQIAEGLDAAHRKGLVHRDIKPANILVETATQRVLISDFGLARAVDDASLSRDGEVRGTPHYMAPEQARGEAIDARADLFSLGSVLYYVCTGELPFAAQNSMGVLYRVCDDEPRPIEQCNRRIPAWLAGLIRSLHQKDPRRRPQSAAEVAANLRAHGVFGDTQPHGLATVAAVESSSRGPLFPTLLGAVFLLSLPAFYFLTPKEAEENQPRQTTAKPAETVAPKPEPPKEKLVVAPPKSEPPRSEAKPPVKKPKPTVPATGIVVVQGGDGSSQHQFRADGLLLRETTTKEMVTLSAGRNDIPAGSYRIESFPSGVVSIQPRQFNLQAGGTEFLRVTANVKFEQPAPMSKPQTQPQGEPKSYDRPSPPPFGRPPKR